MCGTFRRVPLILYVKLEAFISPYFLSRFKTAFFLEKSLEFSKYFLLGQGHELSHTIIYRLPDGWLVGWLLWTISLDTCWGELLEANDVLAEYDRVGRIGIAFVGVPTGAVAGYSWGAGSLSELTDSLIFMSLFNGARRFSAKAEWAYSPCPLEGVPLDEGGCSSRAMTTMTTLGSLSGTDLRRIALAVDWRRHHRGLSHFTLHDGTSFICHGSYSWTHMGRGSTFVSHFELQEPFWNWSESSSFRRGFISRQREGEKEQTLRTRITQVLVCECSYV